MLWASQIEDFLLLPARCTVLDTLPYNYCFPCCRNLKLSNNQTHRDTTRIDYKNCLAHISMASNSVEDSQLKTVPILCHSKGMWPCEPKPYLHKVFNRCMICIIIILCRYGLGSSFNIIYVYIVCIIIISYHVKIHSLSLGSSFWSIPFIEWCRTSDIHGSAGTWRQPQRASDNIPFVLYHE